MKQIKSEISPVLQNSVYFSIELMKRHNGHPEDLHLNSGMVGCFMVYCSGGGRQADL